MTEKQKPVVKAKLKASKSIAKEYFSPNLFTISTELTADSPEFMPVYVESDVADVKVVVKSEFSKFLRINHRQTHVFDCGISISIPAGFRIRGQSKRGWANRGLFVSQVYIENKRLNLVVTNIGQETPLAIVDKDTLAEIWLEPVYVFDFKEML